MTPRVNPTMARPAGVPLSVARPDIPLEAFLQPVHKVGFFLLTLFYFMAFSRVMDVVLPVARLPFVVSLVTMLCLVMSGGLARMFRLTEAKMLLGFTVWIIIGIPFSSWRFGSFSLVKDEWFRSLMCFMLVAGLTVTLRQARRLMITIAFGTLILTIMALVKQHRVLGRLSFDVGMFSNPNDLAQALLLGVPLLFALNVPQSNVFSKIITAAAAAPMLLAIVQTGSRTALLAIMVMVVMTFLRVGYMGRLMIVLVLAGGGVLSVVALPDAVRNRYVLMLGDLDDVREEEDRVAVASAESRKVLLIQSLKFTLKHPLFGVGAGTFQHSSVQENASEGKKAMWRETHNMYTQISSETGLPGFILYFGTVIVLFRKYRSLRLRCEGDPRLHDVKNLMFIYSTSFVSVLVTGAFSSIGYQLVIPSMIGLAAALHAAGVEEVDRITAKAPAPAPLPTAAVKPKPVGGLHLPRPLAPRPVTPRPPVARSITTPTPRVPRV